MDYEIDATEQIELTAEDESGVRAFYTEKQKPFATEEEKSAIRPYIPVIYPVLKAYLNQKAPYKMKGGDADVLIAEETYAKIFLHADKLVKMQLVIITDESRRQYAFDFDFADFYEKNKLLIGTVQEAVQKQKQRQLQKKKVQVQKKIDILQKKVERLQNYNKLADKLQEMAEMQKQTVEKLEEAMKKLQEAVETIAFAKEEIKAKQIEKQMQEKAEEVEQAIQERQEKAEEVQKIEKEKGFLQKAKEIVQEVKEKAKAIIDKAIDGFKRFFRR
jgi:myosin heavy subunit